MYDHEQSREGMQTRNTPKGFSTAAKFFIVFGALSLGGLSFIVWNTFAGSQIDSTLKQYSGTGGIDNGLVAHWTFDGVDMPSGGVSDTSGSGNDGSLRGFASSSTYIQGVLGQGLALDGINDYIETRDDNSLEPTDFTASFWIRPKTFANNATALSFIAKRGSTSDGYFIFYYKTTNTLNFDWGGNVSGSRWSTTFDPPLNQWSHIVLTKDSSGRKLFVNGVLTDSTSNVGNTNLVANSSLLRLGIDSAAQQFPFRGQMDDVRIYNRAVSPDEAMQLYQMGEPGGGKISTTPTPNPASGGLNNGLVAEWTFDGKDMPSGLVSDASGAGNTASMRSMASSTAYRQGILGQALMFDGVDDKVEAGTPASLALNTGTMSAWIKTKNAGTSYRGIITKSNAYGMYLQANIFGVYDNGTPVFRSTGVNLADGQWHYVAASFQSGITNGTVLYIDGVLSLTTTITNVSQGVARIGQGQGGTSQTFAGAIDDPRIYNRILSSDEIKQLYQMGEPGGGKISATPNSNPTLGGVNYGLVGYWTFDGKDMPAGRVNDVSGQGNTGSSKNMATSSAYVQGVLGQGLNFDGTDDRIDVGSASILDDIAPMSISFWMYPRSLGQSSNANVIGKHSVNSANPQNGWDIAMTPTNTIGIRFDYGTVGSSADDLRRDAANGSVTYRTWQHVVMTWDGSSTATNIHIYINGVEVSYTNTQNGTGSRNTDAAQDLNIGNSIGNSRTFDGYLDDVRIYNRVISPDETKQLYQMGR